ncbi:MAG: hypothetical protein ACI8PZ_000320 [Myxococcota bacterium]|jgi:uncharacterized protein (DUF427 family)
MSRTGCAADVETAVERVWDYPRPPRIEPCTKSLEVVFAGHVLAHTTAGMRVLETSHPPVYFIPRADVDLDRLRPSRRRTTWCEFKGSATYHDIEVDGRVLLAQAFEYPEPSEAFAPIAGFLAFYAVQMDRCSVDGEVVTPQPGGFYAGWITRDLVGPFKGEVGSAFW